MPIWKAEAPALDILAPDIYMDDPVKVRKLLDLYGRADNPLFIPETASAAHYAPFFFLALGHGAIGFSPFGIDDTRYSNFPLGAKEPDHQSLVPFAMNYRLVGPMMREMARLIFEGKVRAVAEKKGTPAEGLDLGPWKINVVYGVPQFGFGDHPPGNAQPVGRALVAQIGENQFLVGGFHCRVDFQTNGPASARQRSYLRVEEGTFENGTFKFLRIWNGDQTDWGLNFADAPQILRVTLGTY